MWCLVDKNKIYNRKAKMLGFSGIGVGLKFSGHRRTTVTRGFNWSLMWILKWRAKIIIFPCLFLGEGRLGSDSVVVRRYKQSSLSVHFRRALTICFLAKSITPYLHALEQNWLHRAHASFAISQLNEETPAATMSAVVLVCYEKLVVTDKLNLVENTIFQKLYPTT